MELSLFDVGLVEDFAGGLDGNEADGTGSWEIRGDISGSSSQAELFCLTAPKIKTSHGGNSYGFEAMLKESWHANRMQLWYNKLTNKPTKDTTT